MGFVSIYCFFCLVASFGVGNTTQINTVVQSVEGVVGSYGLHIGMQFKLVIGLFLAVLLGGLLLGGARKIGKATEFLVPVVSVGYLVLCVSVLLTHAQHIPSAFKSIFVGACSPKAVTGGAVGSLLTTLRVGVSRGVFTNEAGMGTASIAHGSSDVQCPVEQGLMGIAEVFIDTIVICTMTALVILCSGINIPFGTDIGVDLTANAFSVIYGDWTRILLAVALCLFVV